MLLQLKNERLTVDIAEPGTIYRRARFDWSSFITQVTLDQRHRFFTSEREAVPGTKTGDGEGLCSEFGIFKPVGYDEVPVGGQFPKFGVGLLTRTESSAFRFMVDYPVDPFPHEIEQIDPCCARFDTLPVECNGYAARTGKIIRIENETLTLTLSLENVGRKRIQTHEYNHNFILFDQYPLGPDYILDLNFDLQPPQAGTPKEIVIQGRQIQWPASPEATFYVQLTGQAATEPVEWRLRHRPSGLMLSCATDFPASMVPLWGTRRAVCPEVFYDLDVAPGEKKTWTRRYAFSQVAE